MQICETCDAGDPTSVIPFNECECPKVCGICETQITDSQDGMAHAAYEASLCVRGYLAVMTVNHAPCSRN